MRTKERKNFFPLFAVAVAAVYLMTACGVKNTAGMDSMTVSGGAASGEAADVEKELWNPYFPYGDGDELTYESRLTYSDGDIEEKKAYATMDLCEENKEGKLFLMSFTRKEKGAKGSESRLNLGCFWVKRDAIYWMDNDTAEKFSAKTGKLPKKAVLVLSEKQIKDNMGLYSADSRAFIWKKRTGLVAYRVQGIPTEKDLVELWQEPDVVLNQYDEFAYHRYIFRNDTNLYMCSEKGIIQCKLDGTQVRELPFPKQEIILLYVNNNEILYRNEGAGTDDELWRIPIEKKIDGDYPQLDKAEKVLTDEEGRPIWEVYANENYIAYLDSDDVYKEYDRKQKRFLPVDKESKREFVTFDDGDDKIGIFQDTIRKNTVLLTWSDNELAYNEGLYAHELGSGQVTKINSKFTPGAAGLPLRVSAEDTFFYCGMFEKASLKNWPADECRWDIWAYDTESKEEKKYISEEQLTRNVRKNTKYSKFNGIYGIYTDWNKLYIELYIKDGKKYPYEDYGTRMVFSKALAGDGELQYEKGLSKVLNDYLDKAGQQSTTMIILEGKALMEYGDSRGICYDFNTGKHWKVKKKDKEYAMWNWGTYSYPD